MRQFVDHIFTSFLGVTGWSRDNNYSELNATAQELLDFDLPVGLGFTLSSLATGKFATSYRLGALGAVDGSLAYLYTSTPLKGVVAQSDQIPLPALLRSYRQLNDPIIRREHSSLSSTKDGVPSPATPASGTPGGTIESMRGNRFLRGILDGSCLLYGRLYLPQSSLEACLIKRLTPSLQVQVSAVSDESLRDGGTILALAQYDQGKYGVEGLASTDSGLLGLRGLYNFGGDASNSPAPSRVADESPENGSTTERDRERIYGRFSVGGELYYGTLNKSGGISLGARFATLPAHRGTPLTATLTINPLIGTISATYAVQARQYCSLATSMNFNVYSYESDWKVGLELWSKRRPGGFLLGVDPDSPPQQSGSEEPLRRKERSFQAKMEWRLDDPEPSVPPAGAANEGEFLGALKARFDQNLRIGLLWEGRIQALIFSLGTGLDLRRLDQAFRTVGLEIQYSS